jgi:type II secretory pathway pseudopilin PulG
MNFRNKNNLFGERNRLFSSGLTLMEMIIALSIITVIFAAIFPLFGQIRDGWESKQAATEALQNGRILIDHMNRNLAKAVKVTAVSEASETDGYIEFENNDSETIRYDVNSTSGYLEFGPVGNLSDLAGPVNRLQFTCYDACDLDSCLSPVSDVNIIRVVQVGTTIIDSSSSARNKTFTTTAYLRTNGNYSSLWQNQDIGDVGATGSAGYSSNQWTINASGYDIWEYTDEFHFVYQSLSGDGQIIARVVSIENTDSWAKAGVMIRETLDGNSKHAMMVVTQGNGTAFQRRIYTGSSSSHTSGSYVAAPYWVKITRSDDTLTGYESTDGSAWTEVDSVSISMSSDVYIGLVVTSHDDGTVCTAVLDNISFNMVTYETFSEEKVDAGDTSVTTQTPVTNEGDLLIAAVATDGDTSLSLAPPMAEGWTQIDVDDYSNQVTLGAWWKLAEDSESTEHQFTWSGSQQAYGWMMKFTGHDPENPINDYSSYGESNVSPTSPAVSTTVSNSMILRLGTFDGSNIVEDTPGLSGHTAVTMDSAASILFEDGFESNFDKWTDGGTTDWGRTFLDKYSGFWSAWAGKWNNDLISDNINTSSYSSFSIEFWYKVRNTESSDNIYLQLYNGGGYVNYFEIGSAAENTWLNYQAVVSDVQYLRSDFRIKFEASDINSGNEFVQIDDVKISSEGVSGGAGYVMQSSSGSSGTSAFSLGSAEETQMLTIAIAPEDSGSGDDGTIRP